MHRFLSPLPLLDHFSLKDGQQFHQIIHVFRAKKGDKIIFFESGGNDFIYEILQVSKKEIVFSRRDEIVSLKQRKTRKIILFQSYPNKLSTLEIIVQKWVELGVDELIFFPSEYSQIRGIPINKQWRISTIAEEALEQSGWNTPITLQYNTKNIEELFWQYSSTEHVIGYPGTTGELNLNQVSSLWLWIGPEGGWSPQEVDFFIRNKCSLWSFNDHILRLETASIVGIGILSYLFQT